MNVFRAGTLRTIGLAVVLLTWTIAAPRHAAAQDPAAFITNLGAQGLQALSPSLPAAQQQSRFRQLLESQFDLRGIAGFVLGPYGRTMSPAAKQEFLPLFRDYLVRVYTTRLARYADAPFRVTGSRQSGEETVVTSHVWRDAGSPVQIDWYVSSRGGRPLVTDVVVDGVSMKATQRSEFASIIQRNGGNPDALVAALRQQLASAR